MGLHRRCSSFTIYCLLRVVAVFSKTSIVLDLTVCFVLLLVSRGNLGCGLNIKILMFLDDFSGLWAQRDQVFEIKSVLENTGHNLGKCKPHVRFQVVLLLVSCSSGGGVDVFYGRSLSLCMEEFSSVKEYNIATEILWQSLSIYSLTHLDFLPHLVPCFSSLTSGYKIIS